MNNREYWQGNIINSLTDNEVFVFGSNPEGIHGAGGAKAALKFGASFGNGRGLHGSSYALVTKNLNAGFTEKSTGITYHKDGYCSVSESQIRANIDELYECAKQNSEKKFLITFQYETWPNGSPKKSLNGYTSEEMFQMFVRPIIPSNIVFHDSYKDRLEAILKSNQNTSTSNKDYILFVNYPTQDILSDSNFWTDLINNLSNVKEHTMGAGIAKYIKKDFPEAFAADKETKYADKNKLGSFSEATITRNGNTFVVINAYTQYQYGGGVDNFDYDSFPSLLAQIKTKYGHKRIGLPLIGCGLAMGDEPRILNMIKKGFDGLDYKLVEIDVNRKLNLGNVQEVKSEQNIEKEKYTFFFQATSPFSQWHPSFFTYRNYDFICGEQFMMFSKAKTFNDEAVADKIINIEKNFLNAKGEFNSADDKKCYELVMAFKNHEIDRNEVIKPENLAAWKRVQALIKKLGREVKNYDDKIWEAKRVPVVAVGNREKYNQNEDLKNLLLAEGNAIMVEASPYDKIWGIGLSASDAIKIDPAKWPGLNLLGNVLTDLKRHFQFELETTHSNHSKLKL